MVKPSKNITPTELEVVKRVARRVADIPIESVEIGAPRTDGKTIWLPLNEKDMSFEDFQGIGGHEGSHIRFGSITGAEIGKTICAENPKFGQFVLNMAEDVRIEDLLAQTFPGFWEYQDRANLRVLIEKHAPELMKLPEDALKSQKAIGILTTIVMSYGLKHDAEFLDKIRDSDGSGFRFADHRLFAFFESVKDAFAFLERYLSFDASIIAAIRIVEAMRQFIKEGEEEEGKGEGKGGEKGDGIPSDAELPEGKPESGIDISKVPVDVKRRIEKVVEKVGKCKDHKCKPEDLEKEMKPELDKSKEEIDKTVEKIKKEGEKKLEKEGEKASDPLEKDVKVTLVADTDDLKKLNGISDPRAIYDAIVAKNSVKIAQIRQKMSSIKRDERLQRGHRSGRISPTDLIRRVADPTFDRLYLNMEKGEGASVIFIIDESGSMESRISLAREAAIIFCEALRGTRIDCAVVGFSGMGGKAEIVEKVYKWFDKPIEPERIGAIGCSHSYGNRDGTSIEVIVKRHMQNKPNPIVIVLSDGAPCHDGTSYVGSAAEKATKDSVLAVKRMGVHLFAISVDSGGAHYLAPIYGEKYFICISMSKVGEQMLQLAERIAEILM